MHELTAFERQMTDELGRMAGRGRRIDVAAMVATVSAKPSGWRLSALFGASRFAVAAVVVALFGGLLLTGFLLQPSDDPLPGAASASPTVTSDILPGVNLTTEEVLPGVYRVLADGVRDLAEDALGVVASPTGDVWLSVDRPDGWTLLRLGEPGRSRTFPWSGGALQMTTDGRPLIERDEVIWALDGDRWAQVELTARDLCLPEGGALLGDGSCWTKGSGDVVLVRIEPDGKQTELTRTAIGLDPDQGLDHLVVAADGTLWSTVRSKRGTNILFEGLAAYDGSTWSIAPHAGAPFANGPAIAVDPDGVVWVNHLTSTGSQPRTVVSWDGGSWASHGMPWVRQGLEPWGATRFWSDGTISLGSVFTRPDGTDLRVVELLDAWFDLGLINASAPGSTAPDGTTWVAAYGQLYVITPDAPAPIQ